ncbi:MAG: hypothetical protein AB1634_07210 [Thermodesulfobacteriota bacterium]
MTRVLHRSFTWGVALAMLVLAAAVPAQAAAGYVRLFAIPGLVPTAVAVDGTENIYVAESSRNQVRVFDRAGRFLRTLKDLPRPVSVATDTGGRIYVGNDGDGSVVVFSSTLERLSTLGRGPGELGRPADIRVDSQGQIYVADARADRVKVYDAQGRALFSFGETGSGAGQFHYPVALDIDEEAGQIMVSDLPVVRSAQGLGSHEGARIQIFDLEGGFVSGFGQFGMDDGSLMKPLGLATAGGRVLVADALENVVQIFDRDGSHQETVFDSGHPMRTTLDVSVGPVTGRLFIVSQRTGSLEVYGPPATHTIDATAGPGGSIEPAGAIQVYQGDNRHFAIVPDAGFEIAGVRVDGTEVGALSSFTFPCVLSDHAIEASFRERVFTVTATATSGGAISPAGPVTASLGQDLTFSVAAAAGYEILDLLVDGHSAGRLASYTFAAIDRDHTIEAVFGTVSPQAHTLAVTVDGNGQVAGDPGDIRCPGQCEAELAPGTRVVLAATPDHGYRFAGWNGDCSGVEAACALLLDSNRTVVARFLPEESLEGFESGNLAGYPWLTGGAGHWRLQGDTTRSGAYAIQAPATGGDAFSFLEVALEVTAPGAITFACKLEGTGRLRFLIDGREQDAWSGVLDWTEQRFAVTAGRRVFRWESTGGAAWLDDILFPDHVEVRFPVTDLKVNTLDGPLELAASDPFLISLGLAAGDREGDPGDWFILFGSPWGWYSYNGFRGTWLRGLKLSWQGPLPDLSGHLDLLDLTGLPAGTYTFYFLVDTIMNHRLDEPFIYDVVQVHVSR